MVFLLRWQNDFNKAFNIWSFCCLHIEICAVIVGLDLEITELRRTSTQTYWFLAYFRDLSIRMQTRTLGVLNKLQNSREI